MNAPQPVGDPPGMDGPELSGQCAACAGSRARQLFRDAVYDVIKGEDLGLTVKQEDGFYDEFEEQVAAMAALVEDYAVTNAKRGDCDPCARHAGGKEQEE